VRHVGAPLFGIVADEVVALAGQLVQAGHWWGRVSAEQLRLLVAPDSRNLMVGHLLLFASEFRKLVEQTRTRGPIVHFEAVRHRSTEHAQWYPDETPLESLMVHDFYMALALMQGREPTAVRGRLMRRPGGGCDLVLAELEWANETWGSFTASFLTPSALGTGGFDRFEVFGRDWGARMTLNPQPLEIWAKRTEWPLALDIFDDPTAPTGWLAEELRAFCRVVRGTAAVPVGGRYEDAVRVLDWIERVRQSAHAH
jgi:predicted dehydrogenase